MYRSRIAVADRLSKIACHSTSSERAASTIEFIESATINNEDIYHRTLSNLRIKAEKLSSHYYYNLIKNTEKEKSTDVNEKMVGIECATRTIEHKCRSCNLCFTLLKLVQHAKKVHRIKTELFCGQCRKQNIYQAPAITTSKLEMLSGYLNLSKPLLFCLNCDMSSENEDLCEFEVVQSTKGKTSITIVPKNTLSAIKKRKRNKLKDNSVSKLNKKPVRCEISHKEIPQELRKHDNEHAVKKSSQKFMYLTRSKTYAHNIKTSSDKQFTKSDVDISRLRSLTKNSKQVREIQVVDIVSFDMIDKFYSPTLQTKENESKINILTPSWRIVEAFNDYSDSNGPPSH